MGTAVRLTSTAAEGMEVAMEGAVNVTGLFKVDAALELGLTFRPTVANATAMTFQIANVSVGMTSSIPALQKIVAVVEKLVNKLLRGVLKLTNYKFTVDLRTLLA